MLYKFITACNIYWNIVKVIARQIFKCIKNYIYNNYNCSNISIYLAQEVNWDLPILHLVLRFFDINLKSERLRTEPDTVCFLCLINFLPMESEVSKGILDLLRRNLTKQQIFLRDILGRITKIEMGPLYVIAEVIEMKLVLPQRNQKLTWRYLLLHDWFSLAHYGIQRYSTIQLTVKSSDTESLYCIHCYLQLHWCQNRPEPKMITLRVMNLKK